MGFASSINIPSISVFCVEKCAQFFLNATSISLSAVTIISHVTKTNASE